MTVTEVFWIFVILSTLQPVLGQKLLDVNRLRLLARFDRKRGSRVIARCTGKRP